MCGFVCQHTNQQREEKRTNRCGEWGKRSLIELKIP